MSVELHVFLSKHSLPDIRHWQAAIDSHGFDVKLDSGVDVGAQSGYLPAVFKGIDSGFEFHVAPASDVIEAYPDIAGRLSGIDIVGNFRWFGDLNEMACAMAAAAALTSMSGGVWFDPQDGEMRDALGAIKEAQSGIAEADS
jgi:hypothetical protein